MFTEYDSAEFQFNELSSLTIPSSLNITSVYLTTFWDAPASDNAISTFVVVFKDLSIFVLSAFYISTSVLRYVSLVGSEGRVDLTTACFELTLKNFQNVFNQRFLL